MERVDVRPLPVGEQAFLIGAQVAGQFVAQPNSGSGDSKPSTPPVFVVRATREEPAIEKLLHLLRHPGLTGLERRGELADGPLAIGVVAEMTKQDE